MLFEALASGGGSDWYYTILLRAPLDANVTVDDGDEEVTATGLGMDTIIGIPVHNPSSAYTVTVEMDGFIAPTQTVNTPAESGKISSDLSFPFAEINVHYDDEFRGQLATITDGTHTQTATLPGSPDNDFTVHVPYTGNWRISAEDSVGHQTFYTNPDPIPVTSLSQIINTNMFVIPNGETALPVNDIETWLACADIKNSGYTTLAEVLADEEVLFKVLTDDNANKYLKRSTAWAAYEDLVPALSGTDTWAGGNVICNSGTRTGYEAWRAFDNDTTAGWNAASDATGDMYIGCHFNTPVEIGKVKYYGVSDGAYGNTNVTFKVQGSNDGFNSDIHDLTGTVGGSTSNTGEIDLNIDAKYSDYRVLKLSGSYVFAVAELEFIPANLVDSELAMQIIGADDFASDILLSDATWKNAILNSEYRESIFNIRIPKMTDNTHPSGEASANALSSDAYKAFDDNLSTKWYGGGASSSSIYELGYRFAEPEVVTLLTYRGNTDTPTLPPTEIVLKGSNDGTNWTELKTIVGITADADEHFVDITNSTAYLYYRLFCKPRYYSGDTASYAQFSEVNLYGRETGGVQTLLKAAGISRPYTTIDELLADHVTLQKVISSHDAIDYLVTAKSFIDAFTSDATAMRYIGKRNYAADTLLADEDWNNGIVESEYRASVLPNVVPKMTSNTAPEGVASADSSHTSGNYPPWKAFNPDQAYGWHPTNANTNKYIQYEFVSACKVRNVRLEIIPDLSHPSHTSVVKLMGSNDNFVSDIHELQTLCSGWDDLYLKNGRYFPITNSVDLYKYYRVLFENENDYNYDAGLKVQFYGRTDVDETEIDILGAAGAAISYRNPSTGSNVPLCTLSNSGDDKGKYTLHKSDLPANGKYLFYSTVAKNPNELTEDYFKWIEISDDVIELPIMPDGAYYWWGYEGGIEHCETANGWTAPSRSFSSVTWETNKVTTYINSGNVSGVGTKEAHDDEVVNFIYKGISIGSGSAGELEVVRNKTYDDRVGYVNLTSSSIIKTHAKDLPEGKYNSMFSASASSAARSAELYALYGDKRGAIPTYLSAANDTLYIMDGSTKIPIAITNAEGKSFDALLEPGTYEIYSSVAKMPDSLSDDYHQTVVITAATQTVKLMPAGALYWYGWRNDEFEVITQAGIVPGGGTFVNPTFNDNSIFVGDGVSGHLCILAITKMINATKVRMLSKGITSAGNTYGNVYTFTDSTTVSGETDVNTSSLQYWDIVPSAPSGIAISSYSRKMEVYTVYYE